MTDLRRFLIGAFLVNLALLARAQDPAEEPTNAVPGMVLAPTALPPLGQRTPDALILARTDVQADLRLSSEQRRRFARLGASVRDRQAGLDGAAEATDRNVFSPLPMNIIESYEARQDDLDDEVEAGIAAILTRSQRARFAQIRLQLDGPMAFARPGLLEKLIADEDQAESIRRILATAREEMVQNAQFPLTTRDVPRRDGARTPVIVEGERTLEEQLAEARVANERVREAAMGRISRVLRKSQWETYIKLRGLPFTRAREGDDRGARSQTRPPARVGSRSNSPRVEGPD